MQSAAAWSDSGGNPPTAAAKSSAFSSDNSKRVFPGSQPARADPAAMDAEQPRT